MRRMATMGLALSVAVWSASNVFAQSASVELKEAPLVDQCQRVEMSMSLKGKISVQQDGKTLTFPTEASAEHHYLERALEASGAMPDRTARHYLKAEGAIKFTDQTSKRTLPADRPLFVAHNTKDGMVVYSPRAALERSEMELTEHFNSLGIPGLLPGKEVKAGETWKLSNAATLLLCDLDGLTSHDLTGKLESLTDDVAKLSVSGTASGVDMGAQVKILVQGSAVFDLKEKRLVEIDWKQSDQRDQGPVSPALSADIVVKVKRTPIAEPKELGKFALVPIPSGPAPANLTSVWYRDPKKRFDMQHARDWHVVSPEEADQAVFRLLDRGDFVAQATVTPWKTIDVKETPTLEAFYGMMKETPGWDEEAVQEKTKVESSAGYTVYRVTASGSLDRVKAVQVFYYVGSAAGDQAIVTFSMAPGQVSKLGARDLTLVRSLTFASAKTSNVRQTSAP